MQRESNFTPKITKPQIASRCTSKRRLSGDLENYIHSLSEDSYGAMPSKYKHSLRGKVTRQPSSSSSSYLRLKKQKNPEVFGQKLSLNRILETLDREGLQQLIMNIVSEHPQLSTEVTNLSPKVTLKDAVSVLRSKLQLIIDNIPYKVDPTSDYSFLRVKGYVLDLFQTLSDYTLNYLPPVENDLTISIQFLGEFLTQVFHKLPKFQAVEFRYYYKLTVDKFNSIFLDTISRFVNERKQNILLVINENWLEKFDEINELNDNHFAAASEYLKQEIEAYKSSGSVILDTSHADDGEESGDSKNRLEGIDGLLNFSSDNNPLNGSVLGNVYDAI
ncbi:DEKNAAC100727 [Brettanomyces naardenensis]|uniref:Tethering factor for nuclear proteasome STS1 n=1 Tax=Brettanomyces naardenensis TaxID=13370 RepID=A0A448YG65_BRENA|nr:DEKNAAC100727 [Brettanomyces naardenensis]